MLQVPLWPPRGVRAGGDACATAGVQGVAMSVVQSRASAGGVAYGSGAFDVVEEIVDGRRSLAPGPSSCATVRLTVALGHRFGFPASGPGQVVS